MDGEWHITIEVFRSRGWVRCRAGADLRLMVAGQVVSHAMIVMVVIPFSLIGICRRTEFCTPFSLHFHVGFMRRWHCGAQFHHPRGLY